ncbi:uncharacterized protein BDW43DRAFT_318382 [Aspergillus alliaceus]|uniref:uncharacterized protein n=1 Tax=Petromyces alliaceus TaxID=209559 RepID=UPI0012A3CAD0|nr:uncharacterized protein BDW43DRAFT_318382 [Aspergillus alliaceus]KAB8235530.1 hypothetical protein BDW43DRAFT_318382 [Aspergillus alliaceus]
MRFLAANSKVLVPKVYPAFVDLESNRTFIIMEYTHAIICKLVKDSIIDLQNMPTPGYLGTLKCQLYHDGVFWTTDYKPLISGPFASQEEMNRGITERPRQTETSHSTLHDHRAVFTYGDLQLKNIMVEEVESREGGSPDFRPDWLELIPDIVDEYPTEYLVMQVIYGII